MARMDRIVARKHWFAAVGSWHHRRERKSFRRWVAEWRVFGTHSAKKIKAIIAQQEAYAEALKKAQHAEEAPTG